MTIMTFEFADRIKRLPPYLFAEIEKQIKEKKAARRRPDFT